MDRQAKDYSNLNKRSQLVYGKWFIDTLKFNDSDNVSAVGCGTGDLAAYVAKCKVPIGHVTAFDPDKDRIDIAEQRMKDLPNISFHVGTAAGLLQGKNNEFDVIYSSFVFHWIPVEDRISNMKCIYNALKPGGITAHLVVEKEARGLRNMMDKHLLEEDDLKCIDEVLHLLSKEEFSKLAVGVGFEVISADSLIEESKFENLDVFLTWLEATFRGRIPFKKRYGERNIEVDIGLQEDGQVLMTSNLFAVVMKK